MMKLQQIIRSRREELGYSLDYVSVQLGVSASTISRWENGQIDMRLGDAFRYAAILGWTENDLLAHFAKQNHRVALKKFFLTVYTEEGYRKLMKLLGEVGHEHIDFDF